MTTSDARKRLAESVERLETRGGTHSIDPDTGRFTPITQEDDMTTDYRDEAERALRVAEDTDVDAEAHLGYASATAHAMLAIRDLLDERLPKPALGEERHCPITCGCRYATDGTPLDPPPPPSEPSDLTEEPHRVHDHGIDPSCRERVGSDGRLCGECIDLTEEPPVGSSVVDCDGDVWERRLDGDWNALTLNDEEMWGMSWEWLRRQGPLRLATDAERAAKGEQR